MREGEIATIVNLVGEDQRFVYPRQCAVHAQRLRLELREQRGIEPGVPHHSQIGRGSQRLSKVFCAGRGVVDAAARPPGFQFGIDAPKGHPMLPAESLQFLGRAQSRGSVTAQDFETGFPVERMGHRRGVAEVSRALVHLIDQFARAFDLAQLPHRHGEDGHYDRARVVGEAFARLLFALWVAGGERPLAMGPRLEEIAGKVAGHGETAAGDAGLHHATRVLRFLQERRGQLPRPPLFAQCDGRDPLAVTRREACGKVAGIGRESRARRRPLFLWRRTPSPTSSPDRTAFADAAAAGIALLRP